VPLSSNASCSRLHSTKLYGTSFARPMPRSAVHCLPSPISVIGARLRTSALCRLCTNSRGLLICFSPLFRALKQCSRCLDHDRYSASSKADFRAASSTRPACLFALRLLWSFVNGVPSWRATLLRGRCAALLNPPSKGIHQVDNIGSLGSFDWLPFLLFFEQLLERILVLVFKLVRFKVNSSRYGGGSGTGIQHSLPYATHSPRHVAAALRRYFARWCATSEPDLLLRQVAGGAPKGNARQRRVALAQLMGGHLDAPAREIAHGRLADQARKTVGER